MVIRDCLRIVALGFAVLFVAGCTSEVVAEKELTRKEASEIHDELGDAGELLLQAESTDADRLAAFEEIRLLSERGSQARAKGAQLLAEGMVTSSTCSTPGMDRRLVGAVSDMGQGTTIPLLCQAAAKADTRQAQVNVAASIRVMRSVWAIDKLIEMLAQIHEKVEKGEDELEPEEEKARVNIIGVLEALTDPPVFLGKAEAPANSAEQRVITKRWIDWWERHKFRYRMQ